MKSFSTHLFETSSILSSILASSIAAGSPGTYKVSAGDTLSKIAKQQNVSVQDIMTSNPDIKDPNKIFVGQTINLGSQQNQSPAPSPAPAPQTKPATPKQSGAPAWKGLIDEFEGFKSEAYWDPTGKVWTIGRGSTTHPDGTPVKRGDRITKDQADEYTQNFVDTKIMPNLKKIPTFGKLNPNQQGALVSFAYNAGPNFYGHSRYQDITKALGSEKTLGDVPRALMQYNTSRGQYLRGLERRRKAEGDVWNTPVQ